MWKHKYIRYVITAALLWAVLHTCMLDNSYWWTIVLVLVLAMAYWTYGAFVLSSGIFADAYLKTPSSSNNILLSFDDGPDPEVTPRLLEVLKEYKVTALFFCIGEKIKKHPELLKQIHEEGHWIGNHTYYHSWQSGFSSEAYIRKEIQDTEALIIETIGFSRKLFRPPFGITNPIIASAVRKESMRIIGWSFRSFDTLSTTEKVLKKINGKYMPGQIVLLHDRLENCPALVEALLLQARAQGYEGNGLKEFAADINK